MEKRQGLISRQDAIDEAAKSVSEMDETYAELEDRAVEEAIDAIRRCAEETHDMKTMLTIIKLCKLIAGDKFEVTLEVNCDEEHTVGPE